MKRKMEKVISYKLREGIGRLILEVSLDDIEEDITALKNVRASP